MTDDDLRLLVRRAIARHLERTEPVGYDGGTNGGWTHASHVRFNLRSGADVDGACLIEPTVSCTHCGYCQSYGH